MTARCTVNYESALNTKLLRLRAVFITVSHFGLRRLCRHVRTTDDIQGAQCDTTEAVERSSSGLLLQFLHQDLGLLVHHLQKVGQDGEMKGGSEELSSLPPLVPGTTTTREKDSLIMI